MKKLLAISSACIIACIFFSSCGSNLSIAKRHYRKGLYIEFAKHNPTPEPIKSVKSKPFTSTRTVPSYSVLKPGKQIVETGIGKFNPTVHQFHKSVIEKNRPYKTVLVQNTLLTGKQTNAVAENAALQTERYFTQENEYHDGGGERAALSLLWIVIVVILILWLIGILAGDFGLGGLINILLVIALILLILWLLRIA